MPVRTIELDDARQRFDELVAEVRAGNEIILAQDSKAVARLISATETNGKRVPGMHPGAISTTPDFDAPLPDSFWTGNS